MKLADAKRESGMATMDTEAMDGELESGVPSWSDDDEEAFEDAAQREATPPPIAGEPELEPEPEPAPEPEMEPEPALEPEMEPALSLGQPVTVLPAEVAGPAVLAAGMKFNPARKTRCGQRGVVGEELTDGNLKVKFETPVLGHEGEVVRVDTQMLSFPRTALAAAGPAPEPIVAPARVRAPVSAPVPTPVPVPASKGADEEEAPLEIEDYTCVSPWENFIHDVAEAMRAWAKTPWPQASTAEPYRTTELTTPYVARSYPELRKQDGEAIRVLLAHVRLLPAHLDNRTANEVFDDFPHEPGLLRQPMWSLHEAIRLCAYFGATEYIFLRPLSKMVPPNLAVWLASASLVALRNTASPLPVYVPTGMSADAEYVGGTVGVGQMGCVGRRRCMVDTAPVPAAARTSRAVTTHMSFLLGLFDAKRAQVGCTGGQRRGPLVTEAAARFVIRCTARSGDGERSGKLATKHTFTLRTRWHSLPTPIESQQLLAGLVDPWNAPVWTLEVESAPGNPMEGCAGGIGALCAACKTYAQEFERQHGSLQGAATVAGLHHRQAGSATERALEREHTRGHPSPEEIGAGRLLQAVGGLLTGHGGDIAPEAMVAMLRFTFSEKGLRGGALPGGCPAESLLARFCWYMAALPSPASARALLGAWRELVAEIRRHWDHGEMLPMGGSEDDELQSPDLSSGLLHQKLQMLNACVRWRRAAGVSHRGAKHDRDAAQAREVEAAELRREHFQQAAHVELTGLPDVPRTSRTGMPADRPVQIPDPQSPEKATGGAVQIIDPQMLDVLGSSADDEFHDARGGITRQGAARQLELRLITGESMWEPRTQMRVPTSSDRVREHEAKLTAMAMADPSSAEARARMQAGEVISDMAAFKAANPGCCFEDFVRWFSPTDWLVEPADDPADDCERDGDDMMATPRVDSATKQPASVRGKLSQRMTEPDNLWRQLWDDDSATAATPAAEQEPLFDYIAEAERVLHHLETAPPLSLLIQLVLAQGCAVNAWFASSPHSHHRQISSGLVALSQAVEELAVVHRQLQPADDGFDVMVNSDDIVLACSDLQAKALDLDRLCGRAEALATELSPSGGRFGAAALRTFQEELLGGRRVPVQRKSEREAVRELFARNFVVPPVEYGYEDQVESGEGIATPRGSVLPHPERSEYAIVVRPRGVGVDAELAGWLTGLHGAAHGPIGIDGAAAGYHRMYAAFKQRATHFRVAVALTEGGF